MSIKLTNRCAFNHRMAMKYAACQRLTEGHQQLQTARQWERITKREGVLKSPKSPHVINGCPLMSRLEPLSVQRKICDAKSEILIRPLHDKDDHCSTKRLRYLISNIELGSLPSYIYSWTLICDETSAVGSANRCILAKILRAKASSGMGCWAFLTGVCASRHLLVRRRYRYRLSLRKYLKEVLQTTSKHACASIEGLRFKPFNPL
ncbi:hypothetical protein EVAR_20993_1 [Eumeta japonica]|uniref:Uncharacterized protein n=1 Tax=Eumeta variegata TaxID=151549 RepID=A0A4C1V6I3_EUMVA|nr:hypothetical protein EVAR_20993_1 [Eumeta japonica]